MLWDRWWRGAGEATAQGLATESTKGEDLWGGGLHRGRETTSDTDRLTADQPCCPVPCIRGGGEEGV